MIYLMSTFATVSLAIFVSAAIQLPKNARATLHAGQVISIDGNRIAMTIKGEKDLSLTVNGNTKISLDDKVCKFEDLKAGMRIRVTTNNKDANVAVRIDAIDKYQEFEKTRDGKFVKMMGNKLEMADFDGQIFVRTLAADVKITCDGRESKAESLKKGMRLRVTIERAKTALTTRIEALDQKDDFEDKD
ncbi:MAG: hypothetical protein K8T89_20285 [Planctomycetes bacterium]|nr:hypothetical protein [Planctomycetota bacterium]